MTSSRCVLTKILQGRASCSPVQRY